MYINYRSLGDTKVNKEKRKEILKSLKAIEDNYSYQKLLILRKFGIKLLENTEN